MQESDPTLNNENPDLQPLPAVAQAGPPTLPVQLWSVLVLVAFALGLGAGYMIWSKPLEARAATAEAKAAAVEQKLAEAEDRLAQAQSAAQAAVDTNNDGGAQVEVPQEVKRYPVPEDDDPSFGSADAEITIIEFSDYECPYCRRWHQDTWPQIKEIYGDKVRLIYRDFPLESIHPNATPAAEAANCAGEQDRYEEFNEMLFTRDNPLNADTFESYAVEVGLDLASFQQCVSERRYQDEVQADLAYASELGVRSTPTFFVNGLAVVGAQPFEVFQQIIDLEMAGKIPK